MTEIKAKITVGEGWYEGMEGEEFDVLYFEGKDAMIDPEDAPRGQRFLRDGTYEIVSEENTQAPSPNMVDSPPHYNAGKYEVIDIIEDSLRDIAGGFEAYCLGNVEKYTKRYRHKNGVEDLRKAAWYLNKAIEHIEARS